MAVQKALRPLARDIREIEKLQITKKAIGDFVTSADTRTESILKEELLRARPDFGFITEEGEPEEGRDKSHCWIIDPIDGTTNFMRSIPHFAISIALRHNDQVIAAYIFDPMKSEEFYAEKGKGTYLNGGRIKVSQNADLSHAILGTGLPFIGCENHAQSLKELEFFMPRTIGIRRMGAASLDLAYVAMGRFDAYWERGLKIWDVAAGMLMVTEAGGRNSMIRGKDCPMQTGEILASNNILHNTMQDYLLSL